MTDVTFNRKTAADYKGNSAKKGFTFLIVTRKSPNGTYTNFGEFPTKEMTPQIKEELYQKLFQAMQKKYPFMELSREQIAQMKAEEMERNETLEGRVKMLDEVVTTQSSPGNFDQNEYMRGMANGLILAQAIMKSEEPKYFEQKS